MKSPNAPEPQHASPDFSSHSTTTSRSESAPAVSDAARAQFEETKKEIMAGGYSVIKGPLNDNTGKVIATEGQQFAENDIALESMDYLVEGVIGSI